MNLWLIIAVILVVYTLINHKFISFSAVQIYDLSYIHLYDHEKCV